MKHTILTCSFLKYRVSTVPECKKMILSETKGMIYLVIGFLFVLFATAPVLAQKKSAAKIKWQFTTGGKIFSSPRLQDDMLFIGSEDGNMYALDAGTGAMKWKFQTGGAVHSTAAVGRDLLCFLSYDGNLYAINPRNGSLKWKFSTGGERLMGDTSYWGMKPAGLYLEDLWDCFLSTPFIDDMTQTVYFGSSDHHLYALNSNNGSIRWKYKTGGSIHSSPAVSDGTVYTGSWDGAIYAIDSHSGILKWKFQTGTKTGMTGIQATPVICNETLLVGARDANFYALKTKDGSMVWKYDANNAWIVGSALVHDGIAYFGTSDSYLLLGLDVQNGSEKFRFKTRGYNFGTPLITQEYAYLGDFSGMIYAIDLKTAEAERIFSTPGRTRFSKEVLNRDTLDFGYASNHGDFSLYETSKNVMDKFYLLGPIVSTPVMHGNTVIFASADGNVYAWTPSL